MQRLEIRDQMRAVENAVPEIAGQRREPSPAEQAAQIAHRVLAAHSGPVGKRHPGEHDRPRQIGTDRAHDHDLPAGLAIADQTWLALGLRV